jgi:hypothetical protein
MKLPNFKRLFLEDFDPKDQNLVGKLASIINIGFETIYTALNKKLTISDNLAATERNITVVVDNNGIPKNEVIFSLDTPNSQVKGVFVGKCENLTNSSSYPTSGVFITWVQVQSGIKVLHITGLKPNETYRLYVVAYI